MMLDWLKKVKMPLLVGVMLFSAPSYGQEQEKVQQAALVVLDIHRVEYEIEVLEREVAVYDKSIRENERIREKRKDKADRLKYKVMVGLSKMDTTVPHKMTYREWQLEKAEREGAHAAMQLAKAEQSRQEKVLALGDKTRELQDARMRLHSTGITTERQPKAPKKTKNRTREPKDFKG